MGSANIVVRKASYLIFGECAGDHRSLLMDTEEASVFGVAGEPSEKLRARRLKMKYPRIVNEYIDLLQKYYVRHKA